ncbi:MAG TPA: ABC transporter substrate-binding protein [Stellaceae bacterium]|nr:ABC transporter substrate-binding protein [Stellaceae bacterium]
MKSSHLAALAAVVALGVGTAQAQTLSVKAGILTDMSGLYADLSGAGSVAAAKLAIEDFKPETHGLKVEIVSADHQNKPDVGASVARQWFDQDHVDAIFDVANSGVALAVSEVTRDKNKLFIASGAGTSDLTGKACTKNNIHWTYDTYALASVTGSAMTKAGGDSWFFITADYAFGQALERDTTSVVVANGGKVLGNVRAPLNTPDFSSFLLQAQGSKAKVIGLANAGGDTVNSIKQAAEFGIVQGGQKLAGLLVFLTDINALGLKTAQGLNLAEAFYWDANDGTRAWSKRYGAVMGGKMPTMVQAGVYSSMLHYMRSIVAAKSTATDVVMAKMKETPAEDPLFGKTTIRQDGRAIHDMYLYQVKTPAESKGPWDFYKLLATVPGKDAFRPLDKGGCSLVTG